jgi:serine phosphatase RsbU (regulator of sigma subunit)
VLIPLKKPNMFVTFAALASDGEGALRFSLAGHLPILRYRRGAVEVEEVHVQQVPLGVLEDYTFTEAPVGSQPGDVFAILTDGLTEVFNSRDEELGLDAIKRLVHAHGEAPLTDLRDHLLAAAHAHGAPRCSAPPLCLCGCLVP